MARHNRRIRARSITSPTTTGGATTPRMVRCAPSVRLHNTPDAVKADPAWVVVAPPDFAPALENVVTLYDAVYCGRWRGSTHDSPSATPHPCRSPGTSIPSCGASRTCIGSAWLPRGVTAKARRHHFISKLAVLASNHPDQAPDREEVFLALRTPDGKGGGNMPKLPPQAVSKAPGAALTEQQYARMERWSQGTFEADWTGQEPSPLAARSVARDRRGRTRSTARRSKRAWAGRSFPASKSAA